MANPNDAVPRFEIVCPAGDCLDDEKRARFAGYLREIWLSYRAIGFESPLSRLRARRGGDGSVVVDVIYCAGRDSDTSNPCSSNAGGFARVRTLSCNGDRYPPGESIIELGPDLAGRPPHIAYYFLAHELFHLFSLGVTSGGERQCRDDVYHWFTEGTATFAGFWAVERHFGAAGFRPGLGADSARSLYGLRPYQVALSANAATFDDGSGPEHNKALGYYASSFWRFIAERHHDGTPRFLAQYLRHAPTCTSAACPAGGDWLAWIDTRLRQDTAVAQPLYLVYADFLTHFAVWAPKRFSHLPPGPWLAKGFGRCIDIVLTPAKPSVAAGFEAALMAGRCVRVRVEDVQAGHVVRVKAIAEEQVPAGAGAAADKAAQFWLDAAHLGVARYGAPTLDGSTATDCAAAAAARASSAATPSCLVKPLAGRSRDGDRLVRTWMTAAQRARGAAFENLYVLSHVPPSPNDAAHAKAPPRRVTLRFGLDLTLGEIAGEPSRKGASGRIDDVATEPVPLDSGVGGASAAQQLREAAAAGNPAEMMQRLPFLLGAPAMRPTKHRNGFASVTFGLLPQDDAEEEPELELRLQLDQPVTFGQTGDFRASVSGFRKNAAIEPAGGIVDTSVAMAALGAVVTNAGRAPSATVEVQEFSDAALRLLVSGTFCRGTNIKQDRSCARPEPFRAQLIRPFGWTYDVSQRLVSSDTPGMALYREAWFGSGRLPWGNPPPPPASPHGQGNGSSAGGSAPAESAPCSCSCQEWQGLRDALQASRERGPDLMNRLELTQQWSACRSQCRTAYRTCR